MRKVSKKYAEEVGNYYELTKRPSGFWAVTNGTIGFYKFFQTKFFAKRYIKNLLSHEDKTEYYIK